MIGTGSRVGFRVSQFLLLAGFGGLAACAGLVRVTIHSADVG